MKFGAIFFAAAFLAAAHANATSCSPVDNNARILASPDANDLHPDWSGESYVGTSWSFDVERRIESDTGAYLKGDLISPRGDVVTPNAYILEDEWHCE